MPAGFGLGCSQLVFDLSVSPGVCERRGRKQLSELTLDTDPVELMCVACAATQPCGLFSEEQPRRQGWVEGCFLDKYPEAVHLSEGASSSCMGVRSASQPEFELVVVWRIQVDDEGRAMPKLDLLPRVPQRALELDQKGIIAAAPASFRALLSALGIEAALESLIVTLRGGGGLVPTQ
ncbi:hypothetical protein MC885_020463 [Smutsia gigantea]|nr:hypothetical protein MC885_020463 [Smutsia gigantea]